MLYRHFTLSLVCFVVGVSSGISAGYDVDDNYLTDYIGQNADGFDDTSGIEKRYSINSDCRRCMFRRDDWRSCWSCYSRPGPIPFYGGLAKRSEPEASDIASDRGDDDLSAEKRSLSYCQCCLRSPAANWYCCQNCNLIPFYGGYRKRSYETSFAPLQATGAGICDWCCSGTTFDFYCCVFRCGEKRRR